MIAGIFAGRTISTKLLLALGVALLYGLLNWAFSGLHLPGATLISLRPQVAVPITMGLAFGPLPGFITGFVGNVFGDFLSGYGLQYWDWSIGNGLLGAIPGFVYLTGIRVIRTVGQFGIVLLSILKLTWSDWRPAPLSIVWYCIVWRSRKPFWAGCYPPC